jgi:hypothetical protein
MSDSSTPGVAATAKKKKRRGKGAAKRKAVERALTVKQKAANKKVLGIVEMLRDLEVVQIKKIVKVAQQEVKLRSQISRVLK